MNHLANIVEIFSSRQGEGPLVGTPMTFVRFSQCNLGCKWCDTHEASILHTDFKVETSPGSGKFYIKKNPISVPDLNEILLSYENEYISITGGEPLIQTPFLSEWLPTISFKNKILLETCGVHYQNLMEIISHVHIISMDIKLPSSTGLKPFWDEHREFLNIALLNKKEVYVKLVVSSHTSSQDVEMAIRLISKINRHIPVILQPASATLTFHETISDEQLNSFSRLFSAYLPNVQVISQMHKQWEIL